MSDLEESQSQASAKRWEVPAFDGSDGQGFVTAGRLQELQKEAFDEAYCAGLEKGREAGKQEILQRAERLDQLLNALAQPFDELDGTIEDQLVELSISIVKQLFRREIQIDPGHVIGVVREAIQLLPIATRQILIYMHPEDAKLVTDALTTTAGDRAWSIMEDPLINRGGCRVVAGNSHIDAQNESRLQAVINSINGDERL